MMFLMFYLSLNIFNTEYKIETLIANYGGHLGRHLGFLGPHQKFKKPAGLS